MTSRIRLLDPDSFAEFIRADVTRGVGLLTSAKFQPE